MQRLAAVYGMRQDMLEGVFIPGVCDALGVAAGTTSLRAELPQLESRPNAAIAAGKPKPKTDMQLTVYDITGMLETSASEAASLKRLGMPNTVVKVQHVQRLLWFHHVSICAHA